MEGVQWIEQWVCEMRLRKINCAVICGRLSLKYCVYTVVGGYSITYGIVDMKGWKKWEFKNLLGMYHEGKEYDRILDCLVMIAGVVDER